jgi:hyperosmotically inducible protein
MVGSLLKFVVALVIVVAAAAFFLGYGLGERPVSGPTDTTGTTGTAATPADHDRARATGAAIGDAVATGADKAQRAIGTGSLTAKIKAKMALDDTVRAAAIDVDTAGTVVTLSGTVRSEAERARALQLARETEGVTSVNDRLVVR